MTRVADFHVNYTAFLDADGTLMRDQVLPTFSLDSAVLKPLYRQMVLTRTFDNKAVALQRTGRLGTYGSCLGQEAVGVGLGAALNPDDVLVPSFREQAAQIMHGSRMEDILLYWGGDERGSQMQSTPQSQDFPICVPVGTQAAHAVGVARAIQLRGEKRAVVCAMGDGATSKGDIYEAMNFAGAWKLPILFYIANNQWAISVPREEQTSCQTLAQKAIAGGFEGEQVDGNDLLAVHDRCKKSLNRIRNGEGPHLIEAITYRLNDHTTADDATRYREDKAVAAHWKRDPIVRLRNHLVNLECWTKQDEEKAIQDAARAVEDAVQNYMHMKPQPVESMFDHLYAELPEAYQHQRAHAIACAAAKAAEE